MVLWVGGKNHKSVGFYDLQVVSEFGKQYRLRWQHLLLMFSCLVRSHAPCRFVTEGERERGMFNCVIDD